MQMYCDLQSVFVEVVYIDIKYINIYVYINIYMFFENVCVQVDIRNLLGNTLGVFGLHVFNKYTIISII